MYTEICRFAILQCALGEGETLRDGKREARVGQLCMFEDENDEQCQSRGDVRVRGLLEVSVVLQHQIHLDPRGRNP